MKYYMTAGGFFLKQQNLATWSILSTFVHFQFEQCYNLQRDIIDCISGDYVFFFKIKLSLFTQMNTMPDFTLV